MRREAQAPREEVSRVHKPVTLSAKQTQFDTGFHLLPFKWEGFFWFCFLSFSMVTASAGSDVFKQ